MYPSIHPLMVAPYAMAAVAAAALAVTGHRSISYVEPETWAQLASAVSLPVRAVARSIRCANFA